MPEKTVDRPREIQTCLRDEQEGPRNFWNKTASQDCGQRTGRAKQSGKKNASLKLVGSGVTGPEGGKGMKGRHLAAPRAPLKNFLSQKGTFAGQGENEKKRTVGACAGGWGRRESELRGRTRPSRAEVSI